MGGSAQRRLVGDLLRNIGAEGADVAGAGIGRDRAQLDEARLRVTKGRARREGTWWERRIVVGAVDPGRPVGGREPVVAALEPQVELGREIPGDCLLYTSDAADE